LEAALIVGIVLSYLYKIGQRQHARYAWLGVALAVGVSITIALGLQWIGARLQEPYEQIFEGITMLLAVGVLTWMIFWMRYQGRFIKRELEYKMQAAVTSGAALGVFGISFFAVFREGIETALFLSASAFADNGGATLFGAVLGLAAAVAVGYAMFAMSVRIDLARFFGVTSFLLLIVAAGLFAHAIHEFQEIGWLPILTQSAWNLKDILPNDSLAGSILRSMIGYNAAPSVLEALAYLGYWVVVLFGVRIWMQRAVGQVSPTPAQA
jgi:high-affinity iron transporter